MAPDGSESNRTLARIAAILDAVGRDTLSASEIARRTELSVSTAHRLAQAMAEYEFLGRDDQGSFHLGSRFVRDDLARVAAPYLRAVRDRTGETVQLWVRRDAARLCLLSADSHEELRATLPVGTLLPLPDGSAGQLLAQTEQAQRSLAEHGWVQSANQRTPGLASVSAPVTTGDGLVAAVCIAVPSPRVRDSVGQDLGADAIACAAAIADALA